MNITIYGFQNYRYFVPANNPHGHTYWYGAKFTRDAAVQAFEAKAKRDGLSDPTFTRVKRRIRTDSGRDWLLSLEQRDDRPMDAMSHSWEDATQ